MASGESQKQLLTIIRDFATEKSKGERRVSDLKKRLLDLEADCDAATADLDSAKRAREIAEQELKGVQVQLSITDASVLAQQSRISLLQEACLKVGAEHNALKEDHEAERDAFIRSMLELNMKIRQFQKMSIHAFQKEKSSNPPSDNGSEIVMREVPDIEKILKDLEDNITSTNAEMHKLEEEYKRELCDHKEVQEELGNIERRIFLIEAVMEETTQLQELARQTSELEKEYASVGEELRRRYTCPKCQFNNMGGQDRTSESDGNN